MPEEKQYRVKNLFSHNYPVNRGEILKNTDGLDIEKLIKDDCLEELVITPVTVKAETPAKAK